MRNKFLYQSKIRVKQVVYLILFFIFNYSHCYSQNSYTFTNAGAIGSVGPTQTSVNTAYFSTNLNGSVTVMGNGVQQWTVPASGLYRIQAIGASGGSISIYCTAPGGLGAHMSGEFNLTSGQVLLILVGQKGGSIGPDAGGGGGSYVTTSASVALIVAGGGGGSASFNNFCVSDIYGLNAQITTSGTASAGGAGMGGVNGNGGVYNVAGSGGAGGGMISNGSGGGSPGLAFINGGNGGQNWNAADAGGYGGGGAGWCCGATGGGGGGYSGGGASYGGIGSGGGGGGSYNLGTNQVNAIATLPGDGKVIITRLCGITISNIGSNPICPGNSTTLTTNATSDYTWSTGSTSTSIVVSPSTTTLYTLLGTDSIGCIGTAITTVTVDIPNINLTCTSPSICAGQNATISITYPNNSVVYNWNTINSGTSISVNPSVTTNYSVSATNTVTGCMNTNSISLPVYTTTFVITSPTELCIGQTATLTVAGNAINYSWTANGGTNSTSVIVSPTITTNYSVTGNANGCSYTNSFSIIVNPLPNLNLSSTPPSLCLGQNALIAITNPSVNIIYNWSMPNSNTMISVSPTVNATYSVTGTNTITGCTNANNISLSVYTTTFVIAGPTALCAGQVVTLTAAGAASNYSWTANGGTSSSSVVISPSITTNYSVTGTTSNCSDTKVFSIIVNSVPDMSFISTPSIICVGQNATLSFANPTPNVVYSWSTVNSSTSIAVNPSVTTTYSVSGTNTITGCTSTKAFSIIVNPLPTVTAQPDTSTICESETAILQANGAISYSWNTGATTPIISLTPSVTTSYTVIGTDINGCSNSAVVTQLVETCTGINLQSIQERTMFSVFPNPNRGIFKIRSNLNIQINIINALGQIVYTHELNDQNQKEISVYNLSKGIYFISGQSGGFKVNKKIILVN